MSVETLTGPVETLTGPVETFAGPVAARKRIRIGRIGRRRWRRQLGERVGKGAQVVVGEAFYRLVHELDATQFFAKQIELNEDVGRRLCTERRRVRVGRLPVVAVARVAGREALDDRFCRRNRGPATEQDQGDVKTPPRCLHFAAAAPARLTR